MNDIEDSIQNAVQVIREGGLVALPTDTVYCLAADPFNQEAVVRVYEVKQRPRQMALPVIVADMQQMQDICLVSPLALFLVQEFFPHGLTLVLPRLPVIPDIVTAGKATVAVRIQGYEMTTEIVRKLGHGVVGTSANIHHLKSPVTSKEVYEQLGGAVDLIMDGRCQGGVESTIVDVTRGKAEVIREGAIPSSHIEKTWKKFLQAKSNL